jgi:hypothetical protein
MAGSLLLFHRGQAQGTVPTYPDHVTQQQAQDTVSTYPDHVTRGQAQGTVPTYSDYITQQQYYCIFFRLFVKH